MKLKLRNKWEATLSHPLVLKTQILLRKVVLPGFDGVPIFDVLVFFVKGLIKGELSRRASALSYNFFMALFPMVLFFFTIIAYLPIDDFVPLAYEMIESFLPQQSVDFVKETIDGILKKNGALLSFSIIFTFYFATRGTNAMISELNATYHEIETRGYLKQKLVALFMLFVLILLFITTIAISLGVSQFIAYNATHGIIQFTWYLVLIKFFKWVLIVALMFFAISIIYYFAPAKREKYRFFSAGSSLATILIILASIGFDFYISNFSRYNAIYGSIGALIILLIWIQLVSMILLIGFELNVSILNARKKKIDAIN